MHVVHLSTLKYYIFYYRSHICSPVIFLSLIFFSLVPHFWKEIQLYIFEFVLKNIYLVFCNISYFSSTRCDRKFCICLENYSFILYTKSACCYKCLRPSEIRGKFHWHTVDRRNILSTKHYKNANVFGFQHFTTLFILNRERGLSDSYASRPNEALTARRHFTLLNYRSNLLHRHAVNKSAPRTFELTSKILTENDGKLVYIYISIYVHISIIPTLRGYFLVPKKAPNRVYY